MNSIANAILSFSKSLPHGKRVLDVGCGLRPYEDFFSHTSYIGIDVESSGRANSGKRVDYFFDGINIPLTSNSFDAVICTEVLEHAINPDALLIEINRVLKPGGKLFLTVPFMWGLHELPYDFRRYTSVGIQSIIEKSNFRVLNFSKLTTGVSAIKMLISSETSNFINNIAAQNFRNTFRFRLIMWLQNKLLTLIYLMWNNILIFDRIYIDNLVIAEKI